jgi:hypothetical protein
LYAANYATQADAVQADQTRLELQLAELAGTGGLMAYAGDLRFSTTNWGARAQVLKLLQESGLDPRDGSGKPSTEAEVLGSWPRITRSLTCCSATARRAPASSATV